LIDGLGHRRLDLGFVARWRARDEGPDRAVQRDGVAGRRIDGEGDGAGRLDRRRRGIAEQARQPETGATQVERDLDLSLVGDETAIGILGVAPAPEQRSSPSGWPRRDRSI